MLMPIETFGQKSSKRKLNNDSSLKNIDNMLSTNQLMNGQIDDIITHEIKGPNINGKHMRSVQNIEKYYSTSPNTVQISEQISNMKANERINTDTKQPHDNDDSDKQMINLNFKTPQTTLINDLKLENKRYENRTRQQAIYDKNQKIFHGNQNTEKLNDKINCTLSNDDIHQSRFNNKNNFDKSLKEGLPPLPNIDSRLSKDLTKSLSISKGKTSHSQNRLTHEFVSNQPYHISDMMIDMNQRRFRGSQDQNLY